MESWKIKKMIEKKEKELFHAKLKANYYEARELEKEIDVLEDMYWRIMG